MTWQIELKFGIEGAPTPRGWPQQNWMIPFWDYQGFQFHLKTSKAQFSNRTEISGIKLWMCENSIFFFPVKYTFVLHCTGCTWSHDTLSRILIEVNTKPLNCSRTGL